MCFNGKFSTLLITYCRISLENLFGGGAIVLPWGLRVHAVNSSHFKEFCDELLGLTTNNIPAVKAKLVELGLRFTPMTD